MTWIKFGLWLGGIYIIYYAALILWDYLHSGRKQATEEAHELTFIEHVEPVKTAMEAVSEIFPTAVVSSGGQVLKQIFNLAKEEAIEYTRGVSF